MIMSAGQLGARHCQPCRPQGAQWPLVSLTQGLGRAALWAALVTHDAKHMHSCLPAGWTTGQPHHMASLRKRLLPPGSKVATPTGNVCWGILHLQQQQPCGRRRQPQLLCAGVDRGCPLLPDSVHAGLRAIQTGLMRVLQAAQAGQLGTEGRHTVNIYFTSQAVAQALRRADKHYSRFWPLVEGEQL